MLIGLNGFKGVGKDVVGAYLCETYNFQRIGYADKMKDSMAALFGFEVGESAREIFNQLKREDIVVGIYNKSGKTYHPISEMPMRMFQQRYGTDAHRTVLWDDIWIDAALRGKLEMVEDHKEKRIVITDVRFKNEMKAIAEIGGYIVRIERPGFMSDGHSSEQEPDPELVDFRLQNIGTKELLYSEVDKLLPQLKDINS